MKEKIIVLKEKDYKTKESILLKIEEELSFSHASITNLDALHDYLSEVFYPVTFLIIPKEDEVSLDFMINVYNALTLVTKENNYIKLAIVRKINRLEYLLDARNFRTNLTDYSLEKDKDNSSSFGVYDENENIICLIQVAYADDTCLIRDVICNDDNLLEILIKELSNICKADKLEWLIQSDDIKVPLLEKIGWKIEIKRIVYTIYRNKTNLNLAKPTVIYYNIYSKLMRNKGFVILPLDKYSGDIKKDILAITDEEKTPYVTYVFDGHRGDIEFQNSFVLIKDNKIVSYVLNTERTKSNLENLFIYTPKQLRRKGYARYLTLHMIKVVCESNYDAIRFYVRDNNLESNNLVIKYLNKFVQKNNINIYKYENK